MLSVMNWPAVALIVAAVVLFFVGHWIGYGRGRARSNLIEKLSNKLFGVKVSKCCGAPVKKHPYIGWKGHWYECTECRDWTSVVYLPPPSAKK